MTLFRLRALPWVAAVALPLAAALSKPACGQMDDTSGVVEQASGLEYSQALPELVFRVPLCDAVDESTLVGPSSRSRAIYLLVGKDGRVQRAVLIGSSPSSVVLETRAKHWLFRPARDDHDAPVAVWVALPIRRPPCDSLLDRPDSQILQALAEADSLHVTHAGAIFAFAAAPGHPAEDSGRAHTIVQRVRSWLGDKRAFEGAGPWVTGCGPSPDWVFDFAGSGGLVHVEIATACDWMQVTQGGRVLFVPYQRIRSDVKAFLASLASTPVTGRGAGRNR